MSRCVVGVDGGGTRTRALVVDEDGRELGRADGPPGLVNPRDFAPAIRSVWTTVEKALASAGVGGPVDALWAGLAGVGREELRRQVEDGLSGAGLARRTRVASDIEAAYHDAFEAGRGVLLLSGTGSMAFAVSADGTHVRVGGWGGLLDDEGSGYRIGLAGLTAVIRAHDGRDAATGLSDELLRRTGADQPGHLIAWASDAAKGDVAALAPAIIRMAREGDPAAARIVHRALLALRELVGTAIRRSGPWPGPAPVALTGGLVEGGEHGHQGALREAVIDLVAEEGGAVQAREVMGERGAARAALTLLHR